jgi:lambda family phage portal protein
MGFLHRVKSAVAALLGTAELVKTTKVPPRDSSADQFRQYALGRPGRLTMGFGTQTTSEDSELSTSLRTARNRSRELVRDAAYAKRAKVIVQNNVVGSGMGMQAKVMTTRDELNEPINDQIETEWEEWTDAESCHTGQGLNFGDFERQLMGQVFEAGEIFVRMHTMKSGRSRVPLALEVIEPERVADEFQPSPTGNASKVKLGIEVNEFGAPVAYWFRKLHPGELRLTAEQTDTIERVPASDIIHLRVIDRWPQTRSMPWMHASGRKFMDMDGLTEAEITAARGAACYMGFIQPAKDMEAPQLGAKQEDGTSQIELEPAIIERLKAGETFNFAAPNRPNTHLDPFMRMMLREVAAGTGVSYESLSRDYSQSNYSSSRLALLDDRDLWRMLQLWFIRNFRMRVHRRWIERAVYAKVLTKISVESYVLSPKKYEAVRMKPRGWSWIDPSVEVKAAAEGIRNGFTTVTAVIAQTADGRDFEDIMKEREGELKRMEALGLKFDNDPSTVEEADNSKAIDVAKTNAKASAAEKDGQAEGKGEGDDPPAKRASALLKDFASNGGRR